MGLIELDEAGAVLNKNNRGLLKSAFNVIRDVLKASGLDTDEDDADDTSNDKGTINKPKPLHARQVQPAKVKPRTKDVKEAAGFSVSDLGVVLQGALDEMYPSRNDNDYDYRVRPTVQDIYDDVVIYREGYNGPVYSVDYTVNDNGGVTLGMPSLVIRKVQYVKPDAAAEVAESDTEVSIDYVPLYEAATDLDGVRRIKIIAPGWGSSGYYSADMLKRDGPSLFTQGTKMFWDHPTTKEEAERPEGTLDRHAATLIGDAQWRDDPKHGSGLYAKAKVYTDYQERVNDRAAHIGVSIRADGTAVMGEAEGRSGPLITSLKRRKSIDFVTAPGAGGKVLALNEAQRDNVVIVESVKEPNEMDKQEVETMIKEALAPLQTENATLRAKMTTSDARTMVEAMLNESAYSYVPKAVTERIVPGVATSATLQENGIIDGAALRTSLNAAIKNELAYLASASGTRPGAIRLGESGAEGSTDTQVDTTKELAGIFGSWGLTESQADTAAKGRV